MDSYINTIYPADSRHAVNAKRIATDTLFLDTDVICRFTGRLDQAIHYIEDFQLLDPENWCRFVNQFRLQPDAGDLGWRGEYWGKMMRGAAFTYSYTKNEKLYRVLSDTVEDMLTAIDSLGRISTYPVESEFNGWDIWCRKYVLLGMQYYLEICTDEDRIRRMMDSMCRQVDYMIEKIGPAGDGKRPITSASNYWQGLNASSLLEPVVRLYDLTGCEKYLDFARYIVGEGGLSSCDIFELAYQDVADPYQYPITKAYEMMSCFEGLLEYYRVTGEKKYRTAVVNFARRVMLSDITVIGSAGCTHELFDHSAVHQNDPKWNDPKDPRWHGAMQETCVTVTWMKFCMQLLLLTGNAAFADSFEQALYNAYLGSINTQKKLNTELIRSYYGGEAIEEPLPFDSYSALLPGTRGVKIGGLKLMPDKHYYGCCACIGSAGTGMISKVALMLHRAGVTVNLYIPGEIETRTPAGQKLIFETVTAYPADGKIVIRPRLASEEEFEIRLRVPAWTRKNSITVNGEPVGAAIGYTTIKRVWNTGDTVELNLDMTARLIRPQRCEKDVVFTEFRGQPVMYALPRVFVESEEARYHIAIRRGPLVLARDARLGQDIDEKIDLLSAADDSVELLPIDSPFPAEVAFAIPQADGDPVRVVDYASAGQTWDEESRYGCWLPTKKPQA